MNTIPLKPIRIAVTVGLVVFVLASQPGAAEQFPAKPNIVFFLIDAMGWKGLGCFGAKIHETPNIDRLLAVGIKFTQTYTSVSICSPAGRHDDRQAPGETRYMWHAGRYIRKKDSIFSSDNGCSFHAANGDALRARRHFPSARFRGFKSDLWDGGHRSQRSHRLQPQRGQI